MKLSSPHLAKWILTIMLMLLGGRAWALMINLNTFTADPTVTVSSDGLSATLIEDAVLSPVSLIHMGGLSVPLNSQYLVFDYTLTVAASNEDYFQFYLDDLSLPSFAVGAAASSNASQIFSGTYSEDITSFSGSLLPVVFDLMYGWNDFDSNKIPLTDSILVISNLELTEISVPEPNTWLLFMLGFIGLIFVVNMKNDNRSQV